ncbi:MAG TPA: sulfite exporter TauE/SafE family protein [Xanthomonadaceae bacterium]|jgi:sulfite exporter TauE/SafE|nr:sulfite exporter TauE/SafE family protein [Xanthomonadaceae bacterium]
MTELPVDALMLTGAFVTGLLGTVHCGAMCGGIAVGIGSAGDSSRAAYRAVASNGGRVLGYTAAGAIVGGVGGGLLAVIDVEALGTALRAAAGLVLLWIALRLAWPRWAVRVAPLPALPLWRWTAPLRARLPADGPLRPWLLGLAWGWLPCGLSLSVLTAAWLQASALHSALTMLAFGLGTLPAMALLGWSGTRLGTDTGRWRIAGATAVGTLGLVTLTAPWWATLPAAHAVLAALGCRSAIG